MPAPGGPRRIEVGDLAHTPDRMTGVVCSQLRVSAGIAPVFPRSSNGPEASRRPRNGHRRVPTWGMGPASPRRAPARSRVVRVVALIGVVAIASGVLVACHASTGTKGTVSATWGTTKPAGQPSDSISWSPCADGSDSECGLLSVPRDDTTSQGGTIDLALRRVPARDAEHRIGSLLVNPGGPGASGVDLAAAARSFLPDGVLDRFDVVGWDPRGAGASAPVDCGAQIDYLFSGDTSPDDDAEWQSLDDVSRRFAEACARRSGREALASISTLATVHDIERIRRALGDDRISFLGFSYGTLLGAVYATLYPDRVRTMVLDGAVDPTLSAMETATQQAEGLERGLDEFFADCADDVGCAIHDDPESVYADVIAAIEAEPLLVDDDGEQRPVTPAEADIAVAAALYSQSSWPDLQRALSEAHDGDGRGLLDLFDGYMARASDGRYSSEWPAFLAISCLDGPSLGGVDAYPAAAAAAAARAPRFGAANVGLGLPCASWPVPTAAPLPTVSAPTAPPIVVIGTRFDPITPLSWSEALVRELGGDARLVVSEGQGHTSFGSGNDCLDGPIGDYLVRGTPPPPDLDCGAG
jgi:pimeloyl-ACP methyl ester carboxylesterase